MRSLPLTLAFLAAVPSARADVKLHPLFSDLAVLQRGGQVPVYGWADPGEQVGFTLTRPNGTTVASNQPVTTGPDGRWTVTLPADLPPATGYTLTVTGKANRVTLKDVAVGDVWVCSGQSNMGMTVRGSEDAAAVAAGSKDAKLRLYRVGLKASPVPLDGPADLGHLTKWAEAGPDTVPNFSAVAYHFGEYLRKTVPGDVPVGLVQTAWGGTPGEAWVSKDALNAVPELKHFHDRLPAAIAAYDPAKAEADFKIALTRWEEAAAKAKADGKPEPRKPVKAPDPKTSQGSASNLFNAMVLPLTGYPVRGAIWYQGEANGSRAFEYRTLLPTLVKDWRTRWGREFPFLVVQLPGWKAGGADGVEWAELRDAQAAAAKTLPKVGMAVTLDVGEKDDVHPKKKRPVGERLGRVALALEYGAAVEASGPTFKAVTVEGDKSVVAFDHADGLAAATGDAVTGFAVAAEGGEFVPAEAVVRGNTVVVRSDKVAKPAAVRYGWKNWPDANLVNGAGLPAAPFRTDDRPFTTMPKKK